MGEAVTVAGLGCRRGAGPAEVQAAIAAALAAIGLRPDRLDALATGSIRRNEPAFAEVARTLGLPFRKIRDDEISAAGKRTLTYSPASLTATGVPSLSEAAALAAAGPASRLLGPRVKVGHVTCAIATDEAAE